MEQPTWEHGEAWNAELTFRDRILHNIHGVMDEELHKYAVRHEIDPTSVFPEEALWNDAMCTAMVAVVDFLEDYADEWMDLLAESPWNTEWTKDD